MRESRACFTLKCAWLFIGTLFIRTLKPLRNAFIPTFENMAPSKSGRIALLTQQYETNDNKTPRSTYSFTPKVSLNPFKHADNQAKASKLKNLVRKPVPQEPKSEPLANKPLEADKPISVKLKSDLVSRSASGSFSSFSSSFTDTADLEKNLDKSPKSPIERSPPIDVPPTRHPNHNLDTSKLPTPSKKQAVMANDNQIEYVSLCPPKQRNDFKFIGGNSSLSSSDIGKKRSFTVNLTPQEDVDDKFKTHEKRIDSLQKEHNSIIQQWRKTKKSLSQVSNLLPPNPCTHDRKERERLLNYKQFLEEKLETLEMQKYNIGIQLARGVRQRQIAGANDVTDFWIRSASA